jgi:ATP-dependent RNA helicase DeaD
LINFHDFGLSDQLLAGIEEAGFKQATPIQEKVIPSLMNVDRDFIGLAQTGTGKTAAFSIPIIENIDLSKPFIQALILTPTRELAKQIENQVKALGKHYNSLKINSIYGGVSISAQINEIKKPPHVMIATPGRLLDLIGRKVLFLREVKVLVLDEADEMLRMGFIEDIKRIIDSIEGDFVKWMFSATFPKEIRRISQDYMSDPIEL